jgi:hypothetical protein
MSNLIVSSALHVAPFLLAGILALTMATPASATGLSCKDYPIITPDNAPVSRVNTASSNANQGYGGIPGQFGCPIKAAPGTCVDANESLSEKVNSHGYTTWDGLVADIERHKLGINIDPPGPTPPVFIPVTGYISGACA